MATSENGRPYHHGDLRRVLLEEAVASLRESGPAALSLRDLARRAGVSHAAPAHHFGDKRGLLTAVAAEGFRRLAASLGATYEASRDFAEVGVAYVTFAVEERPYFDVMFRPDLYDPDDPELVAARSASGAALYGPAATVSDAPLEAGIAAWSLVHGLATLGLAGNLPRLAELRATLRERMQASPLTDGPRFARNVERAYREMWRAWCSS